MAAGAAKVAVVAERNNIMEKYIGNGLEIDIKTVEKGIKGGIRETAG